MTDTNADDYEASFESGADERDDLSEAGEEVDEDPDDNPIGGRTARELYDEVDETADLNAEARTWLGERTEAQLQIERLDGTQVKRFHLSEPESEESMMQLIRAVIDNNQYEFCRQVVDEPDLDVDLWESSLTPRERSLLYDHCFSWCRMEEFVTVSETLG